MTDAPLQRLISAIDDITLAMPFEQIYQRLIPDFSASLLTPTWVQSCHRDTNETQGWTLHSLHQNSVNQLALFLVSWLPQRGTPPHTHGTWGIIGGVEGVETNIFWTRRDAGDKPGFADIHPAEEKACGPGDILILSADDIHSVENKSNTPTLSLHLYGVDPQMAERLAFDPQLQQVEVFTTQASR